MPLTLKTISAARAGPKPQRFFDGGGLYMEVSPAGSKLWRFKYRFEGKEKRLALGAYPDIGLAKARKARDAARRALAAGTDPAVWCKAEKISGSLSLAQRAEVTARRRDRPAPAPVRSRSLEVVGVDAQEEQVYRALLMQRAAGVEDMAQALNMPSRTAQQLLQSIEAKGLASHTPELPRRYIAASPELAVEALVIQRQADLEHVRTTIKELKEQSLAAVDNSEREQVVELITSRAALDQAIKQLLQTVQADLITFQRAPMLYSEDFVESEESAKPPAGVRARSISDAGFLAMPGAINQLRRFMKAGEELRVFPALPVKMMVADRRIGLIPLDAQNPGAAVLLVRESSLLDALCALFEITWERSTPIKFGTDGDMTMGSQGVSLSDASGRLLPLLAAGISDKAIAYEVGISINTLTRRMAELMKGFHARTRFQLGWRAALSTYPEGLPTGNPGTKD